MREPERIGPVAGGAGFAPDHRPSTRPVTRNDVARHAGVSSAVVSYVVNRGPKRVAPATEQRVRASIEALGYQPNLTARALSSGSTQTFGLVLPDLINPFFAEFAYAIERAASVRDYTMLVAHSDSGAATERRRLAELEARQVDGLLISSVLSRPEIEAWAAERHGGRARRRPRTVMLDTSDPIPGVVSVGPGFTPAAGRGVDHLIGHGHRRIALLTGSTDDLATEARERGWLLALERAGLTPEPVLRGGYTRESGYRLAHRMLSAPRPPSAVFAISDLIAVGVLRAAHELGVRVPDDLAVVSFDGSRETEYSWPPLTAVRQPIEAMAAVAVDLMLDPDDLPGSGHHVCESPLIIRRSCGCSPAVDDDTGADPGDGTGNDPGDGTGNDPGDGSGRLGE